MQGLLQPNVCVTLSLLLLLLQAPFQLNAQPRINMEQQGFSHRLGVFALKMYDSLAKLKPNENIIFSPLSIQTCAAMARMGADGETAQEMDRGLELIAPDPKTLGESFLPLMTAYANSNTTHIANKIYVKKDYELDNEFKSNLNYFLSTVESVDFNNAKETAGIINKFVEEKTNNLIKDLINPAALDSLTRLVLINAIHFKGKWKKEFPKDATRQEPFYLDELSSKDVSMMNIKAHFRHASLPQLDAAVLELPYQDSDLSMIVVLPNKRSGLSKLEEQLRNTQLSEITEHLSDKEVIVKLPKFKAEFSVELTDAFRQLGISKLFTQYADLKKMLKNREDLYVSQIVHKAFIDVNEEGTEAAAATGVVVRKKRSIISFSDPIEFHVDHPFIYLLIDRQNVPLFLGSVQQFGAAAAGIDHDEL